MSFTTNCCKDLTIYINQGVFYSMSKFYSNNQRDITWQSTNSTPFYYHLARRWKLCRFSPTFWKKWGLCFLFLTCKHLKFAKNPPEFPKKYKWKCLHCTIILNHTSRIFRAKEYMIFAVFATIVSLKHLTHKVFQNPCPNKSFMKKKHVFLYSKNIDTMWSLPQKLSFSPEKILVHPHHNRLYWFFSAMKRNLCQFFVSIDGKSPLSWGGADFTKPRGNLMWTQVSLLGGSFYCNYCLIPLNCQK